MFIPVVVQDVPSSIHRRRRDAANGLGGGGGGGGGGGSGNERGSSAVISQFKTVEYEGRDGAMAIDAGVVTTNQHSVIPTLGLGPVILGIICASVACVVLAGVVAFFWYRHRCKRQKLLRDLTFEGWEESKSIKSAPQSRTCSPKPSKRMSCPEALYTQKKAMLVRSMTADRIPDFALPPERVQPRGSREASRPDSSSPPSYQTSSPLGSIKPDLYHHPSFSEDDEPHLPESSLGRLWFSLFYDSNNELLNVTVIKVRDLPGRGNNNQPRDPFVKIYLLPDEKQCKVTKSKKKTCSPIFNESHTFQIHQKELVKRMLRFSVYDMDKRRIRHSLGHALINLKTLNLTSGDTMCCDLEPMIQANSALGEIQLSLVYLPQYEKIKIGIHQARKLQLEEDIAHMGAYVKVQLYYGTKCHRMKRTSTCQVPGQEAHFNESLSFTVNGRQLDSCNLVVTVMATSLNTYGIADVEYGRLVIGSFMYARGEELVHWQEMASHPKTPSTQWHTLVNNNNGAQ